MRIPRVFLFMPLAMTLAAAAYGQGVASGDLHVVVKDPQGSPVAGATVVARDQAKGIEREASGNGLGEYTFQALPDRKSVV